MKIRGVRNHPRRRTLEVRTARGGFTFPYDRCVPQPSAADSIKVLSIDDDTGRETFSYTLESGKTGVVHIEQVLDHNEEPAYMHQALLYRLTLEATATPAQFKKTKGLFEGLPPAILRLA